MINLTKGVKDLHYSAKAHKSEYDLDTARNRSNSNYSEEFKTLQEYIEKFHDLNTLIKVIEANPEIMEEAFKVSNPISTLTNHIEWIVDHMQSLIGKVYKKCYFRGSLVSIVKDDTASHYTCTLAYPNSFTCELYCFIQYPTGTMEFIPFNELNPYEDKY